MDSLPVHDKNNLVILTYNVQGLKNFHKLKRLNNFWHKLPFTKNVIINLQETHYSKKDKSKLEYQWKWGSLQSTTENNSGGVAILYNKSFFDEIIKHKNDQEGRMCALYARKDSDNFFFLNIYAPNNHYDAITFFYEVEKWLIEATEYDSTINIVISGDYNFVFDCGVDSVGRNQSKQERNVVRLFNAITTRFNLIDTYRKSNQYGGFTWGRDNPSYLRSRLDHIFCSKNISNNQISSNVSPLPNESDHRTVYTEFELTRVPYGPGIIRCNASLLDKVSFKCEVKEILENEIINMPSTWNPHIKLDFIKYKLREIMVKEGKNRAKYNKTKLEFANEELRVLTLAMDKKIQKLDGSSKISDSALEELDNLKIAIDTVQDSIISLKDEEAKKIIFRSRAKWAEKGEKSNKYFLNLLKERQKAMVIRKIISNGVVNYKQSDIDKAIKKFYKDLY